MTTFKINISVKHQTQNIYLQKERKKMSQLTYSVSAFMVYFPQDYDTRNPAIAEGPRDAGVPVEIW